MKPQHTDRSAVRRPRPLIGIALLVFVSSWLVALLMTVPITVIPVSRLALPEGVQLTPLSGTLWQGRWRLTLPNTRPVTIRTDILPWSMFRLQLAWHVRAQTAPQANPSDTDLTMTGDVALGFRTLSVRNLKGRLAADSPFVTALTAWPLNGLIDFSGAATLIRTEQGFRLQAAQVAANWQDARITTTEPLPLGDLRFKARIANGALNATVTPLPTPRGPLLGDLDIDGTWPITQAPRVQGYLQPTATASTALVEQLKLLGRPDANGKITLQGVLPGRY